MIFLIQMRSVNLAIRLGILLPQQLYDEVFAPLLSAFPDMERRDIICIAGSDLGGEDRVVRWTIMLAALCLGSGIPPTGQIAHMRFHEFFRFELAEFRGNSGGLGSAGLDDAGWRLANGTVSGT